MKKKCTTEELRKASEVVRNIFDIDEKSVSVMEDKFMSKVRKIVWRASDSDEMSFNETMNSSYDAKDALEDIGELVEEFNSVYHILAVVTHWLNDEYLKDDDE
jgi:hypothetical protein